MSYSKLHSNVVHSSLWEEPDHVRVLFITLLALCDRDGYVYGTKSGMERAANIAPTAGEWTTEEYGPNLDPWSVLMSPDTESSDRVRAPENEGRRIEEVSGGFRLLNFEYYRGLRNDDDRRVQNREAQRRFKAKRQPKSAKVSRDKPRSAAGKPISEAEAEAEAEVRTKSVSSTTLARVEPAVLSFDCTGLVKGWDLTAAKVAEWAVAFPGVDVLGECRKAREWLRANHLKTAAGMPRFLVSWLGRAANSRRGAPAAALTRSEGLQARNRDAGKEFLAMMGAAHDTE